MGAKKGSIQQTETLSGEQTQSLNDLLGALSPQISGIAGQLGFDLAGQPGYQRALELATEQSEAFSPEGITEAFKLNVADPAIQQFQQEIAPAIQERAIASGAGRSSGAARQLTKAGTDLQSALSAQLANQLLQGQSTREQLRQGTVNQLLGLSQAPQQSQLQSLQGLLSGLQLGLGTQAFQNYAQPGSPGLAQGLLGAAGAGIGGYFGGAPGAAIGSNVGSQIGGSF